MTEQKTCLQSFWAVVEPNGSIITVSICVFPTGISSACGYRETAINRFLRWEDVVFWKRWFLPKKMWHFYEMVGFKVVKFDCVANENHE